MAKQKKTAPKTNKNEKSTITWLNWASFGQQVDSLIYLHMAFFFVVSMQCNFVGEKKEHKNEGKNLFSRK